MRASRAAWVLSVAVLLHPVAARADDAAPSSSAPAPPAPLRRAERLMDDGRDSDALRLLDAAVERDPSDGRAWEDRGLARWDALDAAEDGDGFAWIQRQRCLASPPDCPEVGAVLDDLGRAAALLAGPDRARVLASRARIRRRLGAPGPALADDDAAVALAPDDPGLRLDRAEARSRSGDAAGALADLDAAVRLAPRAAGAHLRRSALRDASGDLPGALADLDAVVGLDPDDGETLARRAELHRRVGDLAAARADLDAALRDIPPDHRPPDWVEAARALRRAVAPPGEPGMGGEVAGLTVERAEIVDDGFGHPALSVTLDPDAARRFGDFTAAHVGERADLTVDGDVLTSPFIASPIRGGSVVVTGNFAPGVLEGYADRLRRPGAAIAVREASAAPAP